MYNSESNEAMPGARAPYVMVGATFDESGERLELTHFEPITELHQVRQPELGDGQGFLLAVRFLDLNGGVLVSQPLEARPLCQLPTADDGREVSVAVIHSVAALPDEAARIEIVNGSDVLAAHEIPAGVPQVLLEQVPDLAAGRGKNAVRWSASHPDGVPMRHSLYVVHEDGRWQPLIAGTLATDAEIDLDALPGGRIALGVETTDGFNVARVQSRAVLRPLTPCQPVILSPRPGDVAAADTDVFLLGYAYYLETGARDEDSLSWSSSLDGPLDALGAGQVRLTPGTHRLTLRAGRLGREGQAHVEIRVVGEPGPVPTRPRTRTKPVRWLLLILLATLLVALVAIAIVKYA
jgi:hypothetical protein